MEHVVTFAVGVVDVRRDELFVDRDLLGGRDRRDLADPDHPGQRSRRKLHLVLPGEQGVDRDDELLRVEGRCGDGSRRQTPVDVEAGRR